MGKGIESWMHTYGRYVMDSFGVRTYFIKSYVPRSCMIYNSVGIAHVPLVYTLRRSFSKVEARLGNNLEMQTATINTP